MSIIQTIRDKAAWIIIGAIAVALIAFIVQDALNGKGGGLFSGRSTTLGEINGTKVGVEEFEKKTNEAENGYKDNGQPVDERMREQIRESIWNDYVEDAVYEKKYDKLGIIVTEKEAGDILYGATPPPQFGQQFTDANGRYDGHAAYNAVMDMKKRNPGWYKNFVTRYIPAAQKQRAKEKLMGMLGNSYYVPKWLIEKRNADNSQVASVSYVNIPYSTVADSTITVTNDEVRKFVEEHKKGFEQPEVRGIEYVSFDAAPSPADSAAVVERMEKLKDSFAVTKDIDAFLLRENSSTPYADMNISRKEIKIPNIDTIVKTPVGGVYGPYLEGGSYVMARIVSVKQWPDHVKARHILVATHQRDQRTGELQPVRYDSTAKRIVDSIELAIKGGANFDTLCRKYSDDGNAATGGVYDSIVTGQMMPSFNNFVFGNPAGTKGVVQTDYGYHYVEILSQKGSSPAYNIAYFSQPIYASDLTINTAQQKASAFASQSRNKQQFDENVKKQNLNKFNAYDIKPMESVIPGVGVSRELVRWVYRDASLGDVAPSPFFIGDKYLVPILVSAYDKGTMPVERARPLVEYRIRNEKKAQQIIQKIGAAASLDAVSKTANQPVQQLDSLKFSESYIPNVGNEQKVIGAAFNKDNQAKVSAPIIGEIGVFYIKVNNVSALPNNAVDVKQQQEQTRMFQVSRGVGFGILETMKKTADIVDNRYKFF